MAEGSNVVGVPICVRVMMHVRQISYCLSVLQLLRGAHNEIARGTCSCMLVLSYMHLLNTTDPAGTRLDGALVPIHLSDIVRGLSSFDRV